MTEDTAFKMFILTAAGVMFAIVTLFLAQAFIGPIYEARLYTAITGIDVTYGDAFFNKLDASKRIQGLEVDVKSRN